MLWSSSPTTQRFPFLPVSSLHKLILRVVRVLIFVHHDVAETSLIMFKHIRFGAEQLDRLQNQVVEIHGVRIFQAFLIEAVDFANFCKAQIGTGGTVILVRTDQAVFRMRNFGNSGFIRYLLVVDVQRSFWQSLIIRLESSES